MFVCGEDSMSARILSGAPCCMLFLRQRFLQPVVGSLVVLGFGAIALAQTTATTTRLVVSPSTSPVASKTVVTLTATVVAGATPVHPGMVTFCDTSLTTVPRGATCASLAVMGTAQLTSTGTAVLKLVPGPGNHSYSAIFAGTTTYIKS